VTFEVVYELSGAQLVFLFVLWVLSSLSKRASYWVASSARRRLISTHVREPFEVYSVRKRLPFQIKHGMDRLNFYPPRSSLHRSFNYVMVVSASHDVFVAILQVSVIERDFAQRACFL